VATTAANALAYNNTIIMTVVRRAPGDHMINNLLMYLTVIIKSVTIVARIDAFMQHAAFQMTKFYYNCKVHS